MLVSLARERNATCAPVASREQAAVSEGEVVAVCLSPALDDTMDAFP